MTRPPFPTVIDSSLIAAFRSCPRKAFLDFFEHWKPKTPSVHLHAGAAYARGMEVARLAYFAGERPSAEAIALGGMALVEAYGDFQCPPESAKSLERTLGAYEFYFSQYPLETDSARPIILPSGKIGVEFSFSEPLDFPHPETGEPLLYVGRLDEVVDYNGAVFGEDDKTTSQLGASWSRQWDLRSQFTGYCLLPETEVLTKSGWKRLDALKLSEEIVQWDESGTMTWTTPSEIHKPWFCGKLITCDGKVSFAATPDHRIPVWDTYSSRWKEYTAATLPRRSGSLRFISAGKLEGGAEFPEAFIQFLVAIQADGSWKDGGVRFHFSKDRKAERLGNILNALGIEFSWHKTTDWSVTISGKEDAVQAALELLGPEKEFGSWLLEFGQLSLQTFINEVAFWDGSERGERGWMYFSTNPHNTEWVRTVATLTGHYSSQHSQSGWKSDKQQYRVNITDGCSHSPHLHTWGELTYEGNVYCVTVPSSYFLMRYKGRTMVTGNCWGAARASIPLTGFLVRGVSILKSKYDTQQAITYRAKWMIDEWYEQLVTRDLPMMVHMWETNKWGANLDHACNEYGGCGFKQVCLAAPGSRGSWLETSFERRRWDPVTRVETKL